MFDKIRAWFKDSETILWARLQMMFGAVIATIATLDPTIFYAYVPVTWLPIYIVASGVITEFARRLRDKDL